MLTEEQLAQYFRDGFLVVDSFFTEEELMPIEKCINAKVDVLARKLFDAGLIQDRFESEGFLTRLTKLDAAYPGAAVLIHTEGVLAPEIAELWASEKLLGIAEQILGPEIAGHPVWNLRAKTPVNALATVPWHQDTAYLAAGSENTFQATAWIPLLDVTVENGALQVVRGGDKIGNVYTHYLERKRGNRDSWYLYIPDETFEGADIVTCEVKRGAMVLLNNLIPHRSLENYSNVIRWSLDLRWQKPGEISGMEGEKDCILMRTASDPNYRPDWTEWALQSRQRRVLDDGQVVEPKKAELTTKVTGAWLDRWEKMER